MTSPSEAAARPSSVRWRVLGLLVLSGFVSYLLRSNVSVAGPQMIADLGLTEQQLGYVLAGFTAGYTIFQFPGGLMGDTLGPRRALAICMVLWAVVTAATGAVPGGAAVDVAISLGFLVAVRFLAGAVNAPLFPLTGGVVERWFPAGNWALPNGLSSTGLTLGSAAAAPLLAWLFLQYGWRFTSVLLAPLGLLAAALWWWYARDFPAQHASANAAEVALIEHDRPVAPPATDEVPSWLRVLRNRNVLLLTLAYGCMNFIFYQMFNWVYYYLVTVRGFGTQEAGFFTSVQWIAAAIGATLGGIICDAACRRYGVRRGCAWPALAGVTLSGALFAIGAVSGNAVLAVACLAMSFFCNQLTEGAFWAAAISLGGRHAAAACGVMNTGGNAMGIVNAMLVPFTASSLGWTAAMLTSTLFAFASAALWLFIRADRTIPD
jgi:sugar phosphate permease